jgi:hypothetical protein
MEVAFRTFLEEGRFGLTKEQWCVLFDEFLEFVKREELPELSLEKWGTICFIYLHDPKNNEELLEMGTAIVSCFNGLTFKTAQALDTYFFGKAGDQWLDPDVPRNLVNWDVCGFLTFTPVLSN